MKAILVFNNVNDLLFYKWDESFIQRMKLMTDQSDININDKNWVSQLLSPIITSQRVMAAQFGNTYSSMKCKDNTSIVFDELLDHIFMIICEESIDDAHRELLDCKAFVQHICGQNINLLQSPVYQNWLSVLLECRTKGDSIPGASGVIGESGATVAALNALKSAAKEIKCSPHQHYHLMLFVGDKQLALYSSRGCEDLTSSDLILLSIQCVAAQEYWQDTGCDEKGERLPWLSVSNSAIVHLVAGPGYIPCAPHSMHLAQVAPRITFVVLVDMDLRDAGIAISSSVLSLSNLRKLLLQRNLDLLPSTLDSLEGALKKTTDALRKNKANSNLCARLTSRALELRRSCSTTTPLTPETAATAMHTALEAAVELLKPDIPNLKLDGCLKDLRNHLEPYFEFLRVKAMRFFGMASCRDQMKDPLTLHKYVEEFPALIHFVYVDRTAGRFLAPDLADCADIVAPHTIRAIISRALSVTREGYCAATWRQGSVQVCYVTWWEKGGVHVCPKKQPTPAVTRALPPPGAILPHFYRQLREIVFPGEAARAGLLELVCVHLAVLPAHTAVAQARRLAHAMHDLAATTRHSATHLL